MLSASSAWGLPPVPAAALSQSPLPTLTRVLEDLGSTFLSVRTPIPDDDRHIGGVVVYDPLDSQAIPDGALVLGVGLVDGPEFRAIFAELQAKSVSAIVLREPAELDEETVDAAARYGIVVLGITRGASWTQLGAMVSSMLTGTNGNGGEVVGGLPTGDLFALANAIAALLDAPITIEDRNSRVLAFSGRQEEADASRIETVLERQVPERYSRYLIETGFFRELYSSDGPVHVDLQIEGVDIKPRCAIAVRAGGEILGSIWAVVPGTLSSERTAAMRDAAKVAALHLLQLRAGADVDRRMRADLLSTALEGGDRSGYALERLGIGDAPIVVLAADTGDEHGAAEADAAGDRQARRARVADAIAMHLATVHPHASAALLGNTIYGLLPARAEEGGESRALRVVDDFLARIGTRTPVLVGIGRVVSGPLGIVRSRDTAERALRVAREHGSDRSRVMLFDDVHVESLVLELRDRVAASAEGATGPLARLLVHDREHGTAFIETLRVWLDHLGDVSAAAKALHIHTNTCRYRLRRLAELGQLDLDDPEVRFSAQLQLRIMPELAPRGSAGISRPQSD